MGWFDNHCHVDDDRIPGGTAGALAAAREAGVTGFVTVGTDAERSAAAIAVAAAHDDVWATVGLHPHDAVNGVESIVPLLDADRVVAVGECGLDYHYDHSPREVQREAFAAQVALAHERGLPLVIHTREAWDDTFAVLAAEGVPEHTIFHCFTGGADEARRALGRRCVPVVLGHRHVPLRGRHQSGRRAVPGRPDPRRDGLALPRACPPPGSAKPAGLRTPRRCASGRGTGG